MSSLTVSSQGPWKGLGPLILREMGSHSRFLSRGTTSSDLGLIGSPGPLSRKQTQGGGGISIFKSFFFKKWIYFLYYEGDLRAKVSSLYIQDGQWIVRQISKNSTSKHKYILEDAREKKYLQRTKATPSAAFTRNSNESSKTEEQIFSVSESASLALAP